MDNPKEQDIVDLFTAGNRREEALRLLIDCYGEKLLWHIRRMVVSHEDAEDILQETLIKVYNRISGFKQQSSLQTWLYSIATNEALMSLRKRKRLFESAESFSNRLSEMLVAESYTDAGMLELLFQKAILRLPALQRAVFNMRYYDEMSYEEMAEVTGKSVATLKTSYHYAKLKIKEFMEENQL